jgi:hypothetical protein
MCGLFSFREDLEMSAVTPAPVLPHISFLVLLPTIQAHARAAFRLLRCEHDREDAEAQVVALAWERYVNAPTPLAVAVDRLVTPAVATVRSEFARPGW